jgi:hypothetical protein
MAKLSEILYRKIKQFIFYNPVYFKIIFDFNLVVLDDIFDPRNKVGNSRMGVWKSNSAWNSPVNTRYQDLDFINCDG